MGAVFVSFPMSASDETTLRKNFKIMQLIVANIMAINHTAAILA